MDDENLTQTPTEDLEKLFSELEPAEIEKAVKEEGSESAAEPGEALESDEGKPKNGNLTIALQQERERYRNERERRLQLEARLDTLERFVKPAEQVESEPEEDIDPYLDTPEFVKKEVEKTRRDFQKQLQEIQAKTQNDLVVSRIQMDEAELERLGQLQEYRELVNLVDPEHFFYKHMQNTPGALDNIYAAPRPAKAALEIAKSLKRQDPKYAADEREALKQELRKELMQELVKKVKGNKTVSPVGLSNLSSETGDTKVKEKDPRRMSYEDLERAARE